MTPVVVREVEDLVPLLRRPPDRRRVPVAVPVRPQRRHREPALAYGPMTHRVVRLLERAASLGLEDIAALAARSQPIRRGFRYTDALLATRRAAETAGRAAASRRAGSRAEWIVVRRADEIAEGNDDCTRWQVVGQEAGWAAGDAARALVVADLLDEAQLVVLTAAWSALFDPLGL